MTLTAWHGVKKKASPIKLYETWYSYHKAQKLTKLSNTLFMHKYMWFQKYIL